MLLNQYKCLICVNKEYVVADILRIGACCEETIFEKKHIKLGGIEVTLLFKNNRTKA